MFCAGVRAHVSCIHSLPLEDESERVPHSHDYVVDWQLWTDGLSTKGYALDINRIREALTRLTTEINGQNLNTLSFFRARQPSVENLGVYLTEWLRTDLGKEAAGISRSELRIWEAEDAWAGYVEEWE
jgi:6-pyruvoyl-tetrahydropterin synthase